MKRLSSSTYKWGVFALGKHGWVSVGFFRTERDGKHFAIKANFANDVFLIARRYTVSEALNSRGM